MSKYKLGIVIGRFQPFHLGHKYLIKKALKVCDQIILGIGSSNVSDKTNPYDFTTRKKFLQDFIKNEGFEKRIKCIVAIEDDPADDVWLKKLLRTTGKFDISIGDNEWVNGIFENAKIPIVRVGHYKRETLEGTKIRDLIDKKKKWHDRVPRYLIAQIEE